MPNKIVLPTNQLNILLDDWDKAYRPLGKGTILYPFRMVSGNINITKFGEVKDNINITGLQQNIKIFSGKEPIVVFWNNSSKLVANSDNTIAQTLQTGDYKIVYQSDETTIALETKEKEIFNAKYVAEQVKYTLSFQSVDWIPNETEIGNFVYLMLDKKANCLKWLQITNVIPYYNEENNKIQYVEIVFESVNDKYSETGRQIMDFIQNGAISDGFAFPKETVNENGDIEISLDERYLPQNQRKANSIQYDFMCGAANLSFLHWGRRASKATSENTYEVSLPQMLFIYDVLVPNNSEFFYNKPNLNSYIGIDMEPTVNEIWNSYKNAFAGNNLLGSFNILNTKQVLSGLNHNTSKIRNTNPNISTYTNWKNNFAIEMDFGEQFKFNTNPYMKNLPTQNNATLNLNYANFFNINAFLNFGLDVFNYDFRETKKFKVSDILGIFGGIFNFLVGGLEIGWTTNKQLSNSAGKLNMIIPCVSFESSKSALDENAPLSLDVFIDDKSKHILPTPINVMTSWRFRLTNQIKDTSQVRLNQPEGKGGNGVWNTKYLGQTKYEDGTYINDDKSLFRFNPLTTTSYAPSENDFDFVIDFVSFKAIASCDYRISAYDSSNQIIYSSIAMTNAKMCDDIRVINNQIKFNFWDKQNTDGEISYPQTPQELPPDYSLIGETIEIDIKGSSILSTKITSQKPENIIKSYSLGSDDEFNIEFRGFMNFTYLNPKFNYGIWYTPESIYQHTRLEKQYVKRYDFTLENVSYPEKFILYFDSGEQVELNFGNNYTFEKNLGNYIGPIYPVLTYEVLEFKTNSVSPEQKIYVFSNIRYDKSSENYMTKYLDATNLKIKYHIQITGYNSFSLFVENVADDMNWYGKNVTKQEMENWVNSNISPEATATKVYVGGVNKNDYTYSFGSLLPSSISGRLGYSDNNLIDSLDFKGCNINKIVII